MKFVPSKSDVAQKQRSKLPPAGVLYNLLNKMSDPVKEYMQSRSILIGMAVLQLLWLAAILVTGTSSNINLILSLGLYSLCAGLMVLFLPESMFDKLLPFKRWLQQNQTRFLLLLGLAVALGGVLYAGAQRVWGDEERSFRVANLISAKGVEGAYQESGWLNKKHPPLVPLLYSLTLDLTGARLLHLRLVSVLFLVATTVATYYLGRELYGRSSGYVSFLLFLSFPLVFRLGTSAMMDIQLTLFFTLALLASLRLARLPSYRLAMLTGLVIGMGLLTKYIMVLIFGVLILCVVFLPAFRRQKTYFLLAFAVALSLFAGWLVYANHIGILAGQIEKIRQFSGVFYLFDTPGEDAPSVTPAPDTEETGNSASALKNGIFRLGLETLFTRLPSSLGVHYVPLILFAGILLLSRREPSDVFLLLWIGVVFIVLFLTLPDHRYFLPAFPGIAIVIAQLFNRFPRYAERAVLLSFLFSGANLYLFVNWVREAHLFL
jgi:4-amino-4-deoxy-L-arabinose transferase-like glycosyltransferase